MSEAKDETSEFERRLERIHEALGDVGSPVQWLADHMGRSYNAVDHWIKGYTDGIPEYAWSYLDLLEDVARLQAETNIDLPDDERVRREYRDLLRKLRAIKKQFEGVARGYYVKLTELEEKLEERVDPHVHHREQHFGDRSENESGAREVAR